MIFWRIQFTFLIIFTFLAKTSFSSGLSCYLCSFFENNACPDNRTDIEAWTGNSSKYTFVGSDVDLACSIGFAENNKTYIQSAVPKTLCDSSGFKDALIIRINKVPEVGGNVICCSKSGCNWNSTTALKDLSYAEFKPKWYAAIVEQFGWIPVIIIGVVLFIILIFCCGLWWFLGCRKKRQAKDTPQTPTNQYVNPRANKNFANSANPKRIDIMEVKTKFPEKDRERYSAIDRKLYRRPETNDSRNPDYGKNKGIIRRDDTMTGQNKERIEAISKDIFSNDDFREANLAILDAKAKKPENKDWVNVYKSSNAPLGVGGKPNVAKGSETNAFQFKK